MLIADGVLAAQCRVEPVSHRGWIQRVGNIEGTAHQRCRESNQMDTTVGWMFGLRVICAHVGVVEVRVGDVGI